MGNSASDDFSFSSKNGAFGVHHSSGFNGSYNGNGTVTAGYETRGINTSFVHGNIGGGRGNGISISGNFGSK